MLIGLSGKALVGKDTVADYILGQYGWDRKDSFAKNLKTACMSIFQLTWEQVSTQEGKSSSLQEPIHVTEYDLLKVVTWMQKTHRVYMENRDYGHLLGKVLYTPRDVLQFVGTDVMRYYIDDYHCEVVFKTLQVKDDVIITDVRFPNEAYAILEYGGFLIRIERPMDLRKKVGAAPNSTHASETALDHWDNWSYRLLNNGTKLEQLYEEVDRMVSVLGINK